MAEGLDESGELAALMARYCAGDRSAFAALYQRTAPRLLNYLTGMLGDRAGAEDLLQQSFIKIHEARDAYVRDADPLPWFYTIAHRTCLDELRRRKRARVQVTRDGEVGDLADRHAAPDGSGDGGDGSGVGSTRYAVTLAALNELPPNQKEALLLTKVEGRSHAEAAAILGTSVGAIKLRAHRAYEALRARFKGKGANVDE